MSSKVSEMNTSLEEVVAFREEMFKSSMDLVRRKGADYNRDQQAAGDTLFNLRVAELLGVVETAEKGILVRLSDKFMRLISLTKDPGREPEVTDEKVRDTARDVHNYVDYLVLLYEKRQLTEAVAWPPIEVEEPQIRNIKDPVGAAAAKSSVILGDIKTYEPTLDEKVLTETVTCMACLKLKDKHSYLDNCREEIPR